MSLNPNSEINFPSSEFSRAREHALYLLERRDYSYSELFYKLIRTPKNSKKEPIDDATVKAVLDNLTELGLINDAAYAAKQARHLLGDMCYGEHKARAHMRYKGIPDYLIDTALVEYTEQSEAYNPIDTIINLIQTKYARRLSEENGYKKVFSALLNRGFSCDDIKTALNETEDEQ